MGHFIQKCVHGTVLARCRCPASAHNVQIVPCPKECEFKFPATVVAPQPSTTTPPWPGLGVYYQMFMPGYVFGQNVLTAVLDETNFGDECPCRECR